MVAPAPALVELDYLLRRSARPNAFVSVLEEISAGLLEIEDLVPDDYVRVRELQLKYSDAAVGFVDAAVLTIVERLGEPKLATLDRRHFALMRPRHVPSLELLPEL